MMFSLDIHVLHFFANLVKMFQIDSKNEVEKIGDFKYDACNQKVTINKKTTLCDLTNVLKRLYMNYEIERTEEINSRFEFPLNINLKEFCIEDIVQQITGKQFESEDMIIIIMNRRELIFIWEVHMVDIILV